MSYKRLILIAVTGLLLGSAGGLVAQSRLEANVVYGMYSGSDTGK